MTQRAFLGILFLSEVRQKCSNFQVGTLRNVHLCDFRAVSFRLSHFPLRGG
jgi:hypothetical protein